MSTDTTGNYKRESIATAGIQAQARWRAALVHARTPAPITPPRSVPLRALVMSCAVGAAIVLALAYESNRDAQLVQTKADNTALAAMVRWHQDEAAAESRFVGAVVKINVPRNQAEQAMAQAVASLGVQPKGEKK